MTASRHFLDLSDHSAGTLREIVDRGHGFKKQGTGPDAPRPLAGRTLAMIFEKPSTRTRVSFEIAMKQLGGDVVVLTPTEMQIGRGETIADTARVLSRYVDGIMMRADASETLEELAHYATVPVINGLTPKSHPCQLIADILTVEEHRGAIAGKSVAWCGDGNNMATTWIEAAARFDFEIRLATPSELAPDPERVAWAKGEGADVLVTRDPDEAVADADCVVTDTWISMGFEDESNRHNMLKPFRVDERLMGLAKPDALFMHCLPAHREEEATASVLDGPQSVIWDEAENRLHAQKGILAWALET